MADIKISQLGAAATISDSDVFPMTANGTTVKAAASLIKEYAIGDDDISALGDGSPTGAILALNANKSAKSDIAMIEASVATAAHAIGSEFYLSGVLMKATAAIAVGDQIVNGTNCAPADDVSSQIQALTNRVDQLTDEETLALNDVFTFPSGITISDTSVVKKKGNKIYAILKGSGAITTDSNGSVKIATIKPAYKPGFSQMCITQFNLATSGQIFGSVGASMWSDTGNVFIVTGEPSHTYGSSSYAWTTSSGLILSWDLV